MAIAGRHGTRCRGRKSSSCLPDQRLAASLTAPYAASVMKVFPLHACPAHQAATVRRSDQTTTRANHASDLNDGCGNPFASVETESLPNWISRPMNAPCDRAGTRTCMSCSGRIPTSPSRNRFLKSSSCSNRSRNADNVLSRTSAQGESWKRSYASRQILLYPPLPQA